MPDSYQHLTPEQVEQFLIRGHVVIKDAFSQEFAEEWTSKAFIRLGLDASRPETWPHSRIHMPSLEYVEVREVAPRAWGAMCDLCGGEDRIKQPARWGDSFILNLSDGIDRPWEPPSPRAPGWHKDGDFFRHFLDSPEQGLLVIVIWSDINPRGGGTFAACDSVAPVAHFLRDHPEGILPGQFNFSSLVSGCADFVEITGRAGDVVLIHPFVLHASSQNHSTAARFITNPPISLVEPMRFDRDDPADFSLVEKGILRALDGTRLSFHATGSRERVVPERVKRQEKMKEEELARLAAALNPAA